MIPQSSFRLDGIGRLQIIITGFEDAMAGDEQIRRAITNVYLVLVMLTINAINTGMLEQFNTGEAAETDADEIEFPIPLTHADITGQISVTWKPDFKIDTETAFDALLQVYSSEHIEDALDSHLSTSLFAQRPLGDREATIDTLRLVGAAATAVAVVVIAGITVGSWRIWRRLRG